MKSLKTLASQSEAFHFIHITLFKLEYYSNLLMKLLKTLALKNYTRFQTCVRNLPAGNLLRTVGINGHAMQYEYDKFDRISAIFAPRELNTVGSPATIEYHYFVGTVSPSVALTIHNNAFTANEPSYNPTSTSCTYQTKDHPAIPAGAPTTATFVDGNGQAVQVKTFSKNSNGTDGFLISGFQTLNKFGKPTAQSEAIHFIHITLFQAQIVF